MITAVEYVTPTSATKSTGNLETAAGVGAIGLILLLVTVSMAQGRAEQKKRRSRHERRPDYPAESPGRRGMQPSDDDPLGPKWLTQPTSR
jgi:hypothetical protein